MLKGSALVCGLMCGLHSKFVYNPVEIHLSILVLQMNLVVENYIYVCKLYTYIHIVCSCYNCRSSYMKSGGEGDNILSLQSGTHECSLLKMWLERCPSPLG
jgi:hypothetical protein